MFRKSGVQRLRLLSGAADSGTIRIPEMAAGVIILPAEFTGIGSASLYVGHDDFGFWQLYEADGTTPVTVNLQADMAILLPPDAMVPPMLKIAFATNLTRDETLYLLHKS